MLSNHKSFYDKDTEAAAQKFVGQWHFQSVCTVGMIFNMMFGWTADWTVFSRQAGAWFLEDVKV